MKWLHPNHNSKERDILPLLTVAAIVDLQSSSCFDAATAAADQRRSPAPMIRPIVLSTPD